jgi:hypothetical protein
LQIFAIATRDQQNFDSSSFLIYSIPNGPHEYISRAVRVLITNSNVYKLTYSC